MRSEVHPAPRTRRMRIPPPWDLRLVAVLGLAALAAYLAGFTHVLGEQPVNGTFIGSMIIAGVQSAVCAVVATLLMSRARNRLYAWLVLWLMVVITAVSVSSAFIGPSSGPATVVRSPLFILAVLALVLFDTGRTTQRWDRLITIPASVLAVVAFIGVVLTGPALAAGAIGLDCPAGMCAPHGWNLVDAPGLSDMLSDVYLLLRAVAMGACATTLVLRYGTMRGAQHATFTPVVWIGVMYMAAGIAGSAVQAFDLGPEIGTVVAPFLFFTRIAIPLAIGAGVIIGEQRRGGTLERDFAVIRSAATTGEVQAQLRDLLADPTVVVVPAGDEAQHAAEEITELRAQDGRLIATLHHRDGLEAEQPVAFSIAIPAATMALERLQLAEQMHEMEGRLASARKAAISAGDDERRRIEQDLHDGAQLRIILLRGRIERLAERAGSDDDSARAEMQAMLGDADGLLGEIRGMSAGLRRVPPGELVRTLRALAAAAPLSVRTQIGDIGVVSPDAEQAVYFCVSECVQNAVKHAGARTSVLVELDRMGDDLVFTVSDDGVGIDADAPMGRGLTGMADRLVALGGSLEQPAQLPFGGTTIRGRVPAGVTAAT